MIQNFLEEIARRRERGYSGVESQKGGNRVEQASPGAKHKADVIVWRKGRHREGPRGHRVAVGAGPMLEAVD